MQLPGMVGGLFEWYRGPKLATAVQFHSSPVDINEVLRLCQPETAFLSSIYSTRRYLRLFRP
jgi:hypothetical protein